MQSVFTPSFFWGMALSENTHSYPFFCTFGNFLLVGGFNPSEKY
jgi:hypothetical protein